MSVELPRHRVANASLPRPVLFSGNQQSPLGGPDLPVPRMGDRFAIDVRTTQLRSDGESQLLIAALIEATTADARFPLYQLGAPQRASYGLPVIDGAGQAGSTVALRGFEPSAAVMRGQFFSVVHAGGRFVHMVTTTSIVPSDGKLSVGIWPMLRFITTGNEACEFDCPIIEGRLVGFDARGASMVRNRVEPLEFSIVERA